MGGMTTSRLRTIFMYVDCLADIPLVHTGIQYRIYIRVVYPAHKQCAIYVCVVYPAPGSGSGELVSTKASHCEEQMHVYVAASLFVPLSLAVVCSLAGN